MALDTKELTKPIRKLRKSLKKAPRQPSPEQVHDIRTQSRRLEAGIVALRLDLEPIGQRLAEKITPIRKKAGNVRDIDVLTGFASTLAKGSQDGCLIRLFTHLQSAAHVLSIFHDCFAKFSGGTHTLCAQKRYLALIRKHCETLKLGTLEGKEWERRAMATALEISTELAEWPKLEAANLHAFRLQVKQLSYVLKLASDSDSAYLDALNKTKDAIGEWHDWSDLKAKAERIIDRRGECHLRQQIDSIVAQKLANAISVASRLRRNYLEAAEHRKSRSPQPVKLKVPVLLTAARINA